MTMPHDLNRDPEEAKSAYDVGKGKPPKHRQFKKGQPSANPAGRPPSRPNRSKNMIDRVLGQQVTMTIGGKTRKVCLKEAIMLKLANDALAGNVAAIRELNRQMKDQESADDCSEDNRHDIHFTTTFVSPRGPAQDALYLEGLIELKGANWNLVDWLQDIVDERRRKGLLPAFSEENPEGVESEHCLPH
jgi:hypothetical protein